MAPYNSSANASLRAVPLLSEEIEDIAIEILRPLDHGPVTAAGVHDETAAGHAAQDLFIAARRTELVLDAPETKHRAAHADQLGRQVRNLHATQHVLRLSLQDVQALLDQFIGDELRIEREQLEQTAQSRPVEPFAHEAGHHFLNAGHFEI